MTMEKLKPMISPRSVSVAVSTTSKSCCSSFSIRRRLRMRFPSATATASATNVNPRTSNGESMIDVIGCWSSPSFRAGVEPEITLQVVEPGLVVTRVQRHPLLVGHVAAPFEERTSIRTYGMPELPSTALNDLNNLLSHQGRRDGGLQRRVEKRIETRRLGIQRFGHAITDVLRHLRIDDAGLDDRHVNIEHLHFARQRFAE